MSLTCGKVWFINPSYTRCCKWMINDFTSNSAKNELQSQIFFTTCLNRRYSWQLYLYPNGKSVEDKDYLSIFLYNRSNVNFTGSIQFSILNNKNEVVKSSEISEHEIAKNEGCGLSQFVKSSTVMNEVLANNNTLMIVCDIRYDDEETRRKKSRMEMEAKRLEIFNMLQVNLMADDNFSDVTFIANDSRDELCLHKCVLANNSSVFAAMFESNPEKRTIELEDVGYDTFIDMIWFAYSGHLPNIIREDLLAATNNYKMCGLKHLCEMALGNQLSVDNIFESLRLAEVHGAEKLKSKAIEFIVLNAKDIVDKPEFQRLPPDVLCKICSGLVEIINRNNN